MVSRCMVPLDNEVAEIEPLLSTSFAPDQEPLEVSESS